jgi:hypothetical protein
MTWWTRVACCEWHCQEPAHNYLLQCHSGHHDDKREHEREVDDGHDKDNEHEHDGNNDYDNGSNTNRTSKN